MRPTASHSSRETGVGLPVKTLMRQVCNVEALPKNLNDVRKILPSSGRDGTEARFAFVKVKSRRKRGVSRVDDSPSIRNG